MLHLSSSQSTQLSRQFFSLCLFAVGIVAAATAWLVPGVRDAFHAFATSGPIGFFLVGLLYAPSLTAPLATILIRDAGAAANPWVIGLVGGIGAGAFDLAVFPFSRRSAEQGVFQKFRERLLGRPAISWTLAFVGAVIIASPLPDELGSGLLGLSHIPAKVFLPFSILLNAIGIGIIAAIL